MPLMNYHSYFWIVKSVLYVDTEAKFVKIPQDPLLLLSLQYFAIIGKFTVSTSCFGISGQTLMSVLSNIQDLL